MKTHENVGIVSSYLSVYLFLQTVPGFADFAGFAGVVENKRVFILSGGTVR